jgi:hypothetical protein
MIIIKLGQGIGPGHAGMTTERVWRVEEPKGTL